MRFLAVQAGSEDVSDLLGCAAVRHLRQALDFATELSERFSSQAGAADRNNEVRSHETLPRANDRD